MNLSDLSETLLWLNGPQWLCGSSFEHTFDADDWMSELKTKSLDTDTQSFSGWICFERSCSEV